jgi:hypothetical protein
MELKKKEMIYWLEELIFSGKVYQQLITEGSI